jgi:hypothetical protein
MSVSSAGIRLLIDQEPTGQGATAHRTGKETSMTCTSTATPPIGRR